MLIAQISDTHILANDPDTDHRLNDLRLVIDDINQLEHQPDVIVHTGDIVHTGKREEYALARSILETAKPPVFVMMGNKDNRALLRETFADQEYLKTSTGFITYAVEGYPVRLIMLDTSEPHTNKGGHCEERSQYFQSLLAKYSEVPVAVFAHHPPIRTDVGPDPMHFESEDAMNRLCEDLCSSDRISALFCGHVHREAKGTIGTVDVNIMSAISRSVRWGNYADCTAKIPTYQLHEFDGLSSFSTATRMAETL